MDAPWERAEAVSRTLEATLAPFGFDATTTRAKLEADPARPRFLRTVRGIGYVLDDAGGGG